MKCDEMLMDGRSLSKSPQLISASINVNPRSYGVELDEPRMAQVLHDTRFS